MTQRADEEFLEQGSWERSADTSRRDETKPGHDVEPRVVVRGDDVVIDLRDVFSRAAEGDDEVSLLESTGLLAAPIWALSVKRLVDVAGALALIAVFLPLMLLSAVAVKLSSPGPVLFLQERVGRNGKKFRFAKFRSMRNGAHEERHLVEHLNEVEGPVFKIKDDPRITRVGAFIRKYSIDELPQFFHVLAGSMSLVGPRPPLPEEVADYDAWHYQRLLVKPGITCIWQVSGRSQVDFDSWVQMDLDYISGWSPWLDLKILFKTVPAVLTGRGAY